MLFQTASHPVFQLLAQMAHVRFHRRKWVYTLGFRRKIAHSGLHAETGGVSDGGGITTLGAFRTFTNIPGPGVRTAYFAAFGLGQGCSQKTQKAFGTAMRLCASLFRGVAAPLGCVIFFAFVEIGICTSGAHGFPRVRGMGGITACCRNAGRPLAKRVHLPFFEVR